VLNSGIQIISEDIAIRQIVETVNKAKPGETPFALVVGAGFSHGLVPTARDIVYKNLPSLDKDFVPTIPKSSSTTKRNAHLMGGEKFREEQQQREELQRRAVSFWKKFTNENEPRGLKLDLSSQGFQSLASAVSLKSRPLNESSRLVRRKRAKLKTSRCNGSGKSAISFSINSRVLKVCLSQIQAF
jgi:hypothetical protein